MIGPCLTIWRGDESSAIDPDNVLLGLRHILLNGLQKAGVN